MTTLIILIFIVAIIAQKAGAHRRAEWKGMVRDSVDSLRTEMGGKARPVLPPLPRKPTPPPPVRSRPLPSGLPPAPQRMPVVEPDAEVNEFEVEMDEPIEAATPDEAAPTDTSLAGVIVALFNGSTSAHERIAAFRDIYAGETVEWTALVLRSARGRRQREPATRVEMLLGYASEREMYSERVLAEVFFAGDFAVERDTTITFRATLAEANIYARRLVLDGATPA